MKNKNELESDFEILKPKIAAKVAEATENLRAANALAQRCGMDLKDCRYQYNEDTYEEYEMSEIYKLIDEFRECGWNTSSLMC